LVDKLFSEQAFIVLQKSMDAGAMRQKVVANNVANINTPGFRKSRVEFEEELRSILESQSSRSATSNPKILSPDQRALSSLEPKTVMAESVAVGGNANNVDIDEEMASLSKNNLYYNTLSQLVSFKFRMLKSVINNGRG
jgi:flagellar basal-body rod protein FlgB